MFDVNGDGVLKLGDIAITGTTYFNVNSPDTDVEVRGSLYLDGASQLTMVSGASLKVQGDLLYAYTSESKLATDTAVLYMNGSGMQWLEVGGEDLGLTGSSSGNFGFGRLVIGQEGQPTIVMPLDLFDNGHRSPGMHEALYLYGVGGMEGLELLDGSTLILDGINVYAQQHEGWVHLNDLFDPGVTKISFSGGMIVVPEPSTFVLLGVAALMFLLLRFRRRLK